MGHHTSASEDVQQNASGFDWLLALFFQVLKLFAKLLPRLMCLIDDVPFLLMHTGSIGPYLLAAAGFVIFPVQIIYSGIKLHNARKSPQSPYYKTKIAANASTIAFASIGLLVAGGLLTCIILAFPIFAAVCSIAIPAMMSVIGIVELSESIAKLNIAYKNHDQLTPFEHKKAVTDAARGVMFNSIFLGLSLAITALAVVSVLSGLGVLSLGLLPTFILIGVVATALVLKIFEIADKNHGKNTGNNHKVTNAIHRAWLGFTAMLGFSRQKAYLSEIQKERSVKAHPNLHAALGVNENDDDTNSSASSPSSERSNNGTPSPPPASPPTDQTTRKVVSFTGKSF